MFLSWRTGSVALLALLIQPGVFRGQEPRVGLPWDWSNRQVVFSAPQSYAAAAAIAVDPRYRLMLLQRSRVLRLPDDPGDANPAIIRQFGKRHRDWGQSMNNVAVRQVGLESGIFPAKYSFNASNPTPNCASDYVVFTVDSSSSSAFNIVGFNNLYVNSAGTGLCSGTSPSPVFSYNVSQNAGAIASSPTLSLDGTQIAFLEASSPARFTVLKWKSGNVVAASWPTPFNSSPLSSCASSAAPCEYSVALSHSVDVGQSAFIDYTNDVAYIVDNQGSLSAISPVFKGGSRPYFGLSRWVSRALILRLFTTPSPKMSSWPTACAKPILCEPLQPHWARASADRRHAPVAYRLPCPPNRGVSPPARLSIQPRRKCFTSRLMPTARMQNSVSTAPLSVRPPRL